MSKIAVVYWSGTGNTEVMANCIVAGATSAGAEATAFTATEFTEDMVASFDAFAFGCPSMGAEELEDGEFLPMWESVNGSLADKKVAFFGSYGWGDGEWMRTWEEESANLNIVGTFICNESPDDDATKACEELAAKLV